MSPLLRKKDIIRLYPKKLNYLFLAVFAFSSPFCYAKTAFSCSRALLSPCTPVLFMVKDVVKSECRMIDMWSFFRCIFRLKSTRYVVTAKGRDDDYVVMQLSSKEQRRVGCSFFCRCCIVTLIQAVVKAP